MPTMNLSRWLFGKGQEHRGILLGLDFSGKTTLLYQLKLGKVPQAIPTMGFNVEMIAHPKGPDFQLWDFGGTSGCDKMRPLAHNYITKDSFILFVYDCADEIRLDEALEELQARLAMMEKGAESQYIWILLNKQDLLPLNKRDQIVSEIRKKFEKVAAIYHNQFRIKVLDLPGFSAKTGNQLSAAMDEIQRTLTNSPSSLNSAKVADSQKKSESMITSLSEKELLNRVEKANSVAERADDFWEAFTSGKLEAWDHYAHLRAGYFVMLESFASGQGIFRCSELFIEHLERLRNANPQRFRNTTHRTMTVFWVEQLFRSATAYQADKNLGDFPQREEFGEVLLTTPFLMNPRLWETYYSKEVMFTPEAKQSWHLPDLNPFPAIIRRQEQKQIVAGTTDAADESNRILEFAFTVAQNTIGPGVRRGAVVKHALETLQSSTIRHRATNPDISPYSETKAYFWIQIVYAAVRSLADDDVDPSGTTAKFRGLVSALPFPAFKEMFGFSGTEWRQYYTPKLWESIPARLMFTNPDMKPLPNVISVASNSAVRNARVQMINSTARFSAISYDPPKAEALAIGAAALVNSINQEEKASPHADTRAELLLFLYEQLIANDKSSTEEADPSHYSKRKELSQRLNAVLEVTGASVDGITPKLFWVQQVLATVNGNRAAPSFEEFMRDHPHLAYENLPLVYYSPEVWLSNEAREAFVPPDRKSFSSILQNSSNEPEDSLFSTAD